MMVLLTKIVCKVSLKALTILANRSILDAWLSLECVSVDWYIAVLKSQTKVRVDGRQVKMKSF